MLGFFKQDMLKFLQRNDVDIYDYDYKKSENYIKIKNTQIFNSNYGKMSLEEFIERYILTKNEVLDTYNSIYDLGNPYELSDEECEDTALASEIISLSASDESKADIKKWGKSKDKQDRVAVREAKNAEQESANELASLFSRPGGYRDRLKNFLSLDLDLFDNKILRNKRENAKILFFFYMLEKEYFPETNVIKLLNTPSMENIDNFDLGLETYNGNIIRFIKNSLEKEMSSVIRWKIKDTLQSIMFEWNHFWVDIFLKTDSMTNVGPEYNFEEKIALSLLQPLPEKIILKNNVTKYSHSPIETLYLKVLQHEYLGQITDIFKVNLNQREVDCRKRLKFIKEMEQLAGCPIDINAVEKYIVDNIFEVAKYVYLKSKTTRDQRNRILNSKEKVRRWIDFCIRSNIFINVNDILTELLLVSCLQAILDDKNDTFNYTFPLYQDHMKHIPTVSAVLKNSKRTLDALQIYWVRKVMDCLYANIGRHNFRTQFRDLENLCDVILIKLFSRPSCVEMLEVHEVYFRKIHDVFYTKTDEINAVRAFEEHLNNRGFKYIDDDNKIRYAFLCPPEIKQTYDFLIFLIDDTLNDNNSELQILLEAHAKNREEFMELNFKLLFDYQTKVCTMSEFIITPI